MSQERLGRLRLCMQQLGPEVVDHVPMTSGERCHANAGIWGALERERRELEAGRPAFRALVQHLRERADVQNIDLMELAGFCRNCLSRWYREAAEERGIELEDAEAREIVYGMPYSEWKSRHQAPEPAG